MANNANWMDYIQNPRSYVLKKYLFDMIGDRFSKHDQIVERLCHYLVTEGDIQQFGKLMVDIYETAYLKAVDDHKDALARAGLKATIVPPKSQAETRT